MHTLAPCPGCARHIKVESAVCPFCDASTGDLVPLGFDPERAPARVRFAAMALGASMALTACPSTSGPAAVYGAPPTPIAVPDAGFEAVHAPTPVYGLPPNQLDPPTPPTPRVVDAGAPRPIPTPVPPYGIAPREQGTVAPRDRGTVAPVYGGPPRR